MFGKKDKGKEHEVRSVDANDLGPYPEKVNSSPSKQTTTERALRMTTIGLGVSAASNIAFVSLIIAMLPLKEVYPYMVTFKESDDQVVALEPISTSAPGIQYATEANVRQYVKLRHSFSPVNSIMDAQWGPASMLAAMTDEQAFGKFTQSSGAERAQLMQLGYNRQIEIESATMIRPDTWQVNFTSIDSRGGAGGTLSSGILTQDSSSAEADPMASIQASMVPASTTRRWLATMTINYEPQRVSYDERLLNPLGFTVTEYSVTERN